MFFNYSVVKITAN